MYLLVKYTPLFLDMRGWTPREAWQLLINQLTQDDCLLDCQVLVDWM